MGAAETFSQGEPLPYEVLGVLEETASTTVYLARALPEAPPGQPAQVALERLWTGGTFARERFLDVARVAERIGSAPNRCFFGLGEVDGQPCVVWEPLEGMSLRELAELRPGLLGEARWTATVCHLVVQAAESILAVMDEGLALGSDFQLTGEDLWVLGDGSTRVRVLERIIGEISGSGPQADAPRQVDPEPASALRNCLWRLLLGDAPDAASDAPMIVPLGLTRLPPTLQSILLETASGGPGLQEMNVTSLIGALRSFLAHESSRPSPRELADLLVPREDDDGNRRAPKSSGIAPAIKVGVPEDATLEEDTELEVPIDVVPIGGEETVVAPPPSLPRPSRKASVAPSGGAPAPYIPPVPASALGLAASAAAPSMSSPFVLPAAPSPESGRSVLGRSRFDELPDLPVLGPDEDQPRSARPSHAPKYGVPARPVKRSAESSSKQTPRMVIPDNPRAKGGTLKAILWVVLFVVLGSAVGVAGALFWKSGGIDWVRGVLVDQAAPAMDAP